MMEENDKLKTLYSTLKNDGYDDIGTEEQFRGAMKDKEKAEKLYSVLKNDGYDDIGEDGNAFYSALNPDHENAEAETAPQPMAQETIPANAEAEPEPMQVKPVEGFGEGFKQGWKGLKEGMKYFSGEAANLFTGSGEEETRALKRLEEMQASGNAGMLATWSGDGYKGADGKQVYVPAGAEREDLDLIVETIKEAGGDIDKAKRMLAERAEKEHSWGDEMKASAAEGMKQMRPTKGFGAWVGNLVPQMIPSAAAIALSVLTKNPKYANMIGGVGMGGMTASTAGQSMMEAREDGASNAQTWAVGITDGVIEFATEKIPFDNYTKRLFNGVKKETGKKLAEAVTDNSSPVRTELEHLLTQANKKLGGKLLSGKNAKDYITSIAAEGASEFTAEALQTITPMIYENPEDYPSITEILSNGWEGAKAGLFMGAALGGASKIAEHHEQRLRRKEQGYVDVAQVRMDGNEDVVEVVGQDENTGNLQVLHDGRLKEVKRGDVMESHRFSFEEFDKGALDAEVEESYNNGYSLHTAEEMNDAKNMYDYQRERMKSELGVNDEALAEEAVDWIGEVQNAMDSGTEEGKKRADTILDYLNAKQVRDGMIQRVRDDIDGRIEQSNAMLDARTNRTTGMIQGATMKQDDRRVYVVSGNLVPYADGSGIDNQASDGSIIVCDAETGKLEQVSPESVFNMDEPSNPLDEKYWAAEAIRQQYAQQEADKMDGKVTFNQGDMYAVTGVDGKAVNVTVAANAQGIVDNGDGTVNVTDGTNVFPMSKEVIQQQKDAEGMSRVVQFEQQRQAERAAGREQAAQQPMLEYNDEVELTGDNGNTLRGSIQEINEDGVLVDVEDITTGMWKPEFYKKEDLKGRLVGVKRDGETLWQAAAEKPALNAVTQETDAQGPVQPQVRETAVQTMSQSALERIPVNEKGEQDFEAASSEDTSAALLELSESVDDAKDTARQMIELYKGQMKNAEKANTTGKNIQEIVRLKQEKKAELERINGKIAYWSEVSEKIEQKRPGGIMVQAEAASEENQQRLAQMTPEEQKAAQEEVQRKIDAGAYSRETPRKRARYVKEDGEMGTANTPLEHVLREIATGRITFRWNSEGETKGLGAHLGFSGSEFERKKFIWALSADGMLPEVAAEQIHADMPQSLQGFVSDQDVFNMILDVFQQYGSPSNMWKEAKSLHGTETEESLPGYEADMERQAMEWEASQNRMTVEEWTAYCDYIEEELGNMYSSMTDEEINAIFEEFYNHFISKNGTGRNETESAGSTEGQTDRKQGDGVRPENESDNAWTAESGSKPALAADEADGKGRGVVFEQESELTRKAEGNGRPNEKASGRDNDEQRQTDRRGVAANPTRSMEGDRNGSDLRVFEKGLATSYDEYSEYSERTRRARESERLVNIAKENGLFIPLKDTRNLGERHPKRTGESVVYLDEKRGKVIKIKDPYAKAAMKSGVRPEDAVFEHLVHNFLFPETSYTLEGISEEDGDVRIILSQDFVNSAGKPTREQIAEALAVRGLFPEDNYSFGNELVSVADVEGDNVLLGEDGTVYFIDPIIRFKKPLREIITTLGGAEKQTPTIGEQVQAAEAKVNTNPTDKQKEAGNYKKGHVQVGAFDITIEQPKGSVRSGVDAGGNKWETTMQNTYGYIRGTEGVDGDHIDVFLSDDIDGWNGRRVFVVDQYNEDGSFDEHKVMLGFNSQEDAETAYFANYDSDWAKKHKTVVTPVNLEDFEKWMASSHRKTKAFAEYKSVKESKPEKQRTEGQASAEKMGSASQEGSAGSYQYIIKFEDAPVLEKWANNEERRRTIFDECIRAYNDAEVRYVPLIQFGEGKPIEMSFDFFLKSYTEFRGSYLTKNEMPYLKVYYDYIHDTLKKAYEANKNKEKTAKEKASSRGGGYTITPAQYTTKKGKVLDMQLVTPNVELSKDEFRRVNALAKGLKGWFDAKLRGFMMRSDDDAKKIAALMDGMNAQEHKENANEPLEDEYDEFESVAESAEERPSQMSIWKANAVPINTDGSYDIILNGEEEHIIITKDFGNGVFVADAVNSQGEKHQFVGITADEIRNGIALKLDKTEGRSGNGNAANENIDSKPAGGSTNKWKYSVHVDKETGYTTLTRDDVSGPVPVGDGRFRYTADSPEEMLELIRNPKNFSQEVRDAVETSLSNRVEIRKAFREMEEKNKREREAMLTNGVNGYRIGEEVSYKGKKAKIYDFEEYEDHKPVLDIGLAPVVYEVVEWNDIKKLIADSEDSFAKKLNEGASKDEKSTEASYGANNKMVTNEQYAKLRERMKKKLGQFNMGMDPEMIEIGTQMAVYHFEAGARKFADYAKRMISDCGDGIRPYLKSFYNAIRDYPGINDGEMTPYDAVRTFDVANFDKEGTDVIALADEIVKEETIEKKVKQALKPSENDKPASELEGDSSEFQERQKEEKSFVNDIIKGLEDAVMNKGVMQMADVKRILKDYVRISELPTNDIQELVELALTNLTRRVAQDDSLSMKEKYDNIVAIYKAQPLLNARDSTRVELQQYSTPTPFGFLMGQFMREGREVHSMLEPSAGNGALTISFDPAIVHANDIDPRRLTNLRTLGYKQVTRQDALLPFAGEKADAVATNPPFGNTTLKEYDNIFKISSLEGQMAINALDNMKDDGRAAIIIGGNTEYRDNGAMKPKDLQFFGYLYSHYNVADVINIDGAMYARNGTRYPVRIILIDGRKTGEFERVYPPVKSKGRAEQVKTFEELYNRINDDILQLQQVGHQADSSHGPASTADGRDSKGNSKADHLADSGSWRESVRGSKKVGSEDGMGKGIHSERGDRGTRTDERGSKRTDGLGDGNNGHAGSTASVQQPKSGKSGKTAGSPMLDLFGDAGGNGGNDAGRVSQQPAPGRARLEVGLTDEKVAYPNRSQSGTLMSVVPANQAQVLAESLAEIGDVDQFLVDELGYANKEELFDKMAAEQVDSVALAIHQMNNGNAFIIGDMTGVGKGRQGAALIRYAVKKGKKPLYFTQKSALFADNYRDLCDIGSSNLRPFIIASSNDGVITDAKGNVVHKLPTKKEVERVMEYVSKHGTLPEEYDYVLCTYDQVNSGTVEYEAQGSEIVQKDRKGANKPIHVNGQKRRNFIEKLASGNIMVLDESHTVGGDGGGSMFMRYLMPKIGGVTFLSATFAKRADNMPLYAMRTAISASGIKPDELIDAVSRGGVTLQEIMSKQLVQSGQMIRRERSFQGVTIDWLPVSEEADMMQRAQFNEVAEIFSAIRDFQNKYIRPLVDGLSEGLAEEGGFGAIQQGTEAMGVMNVPFASKMYNLVNQLLFALKAEAVADRVIYNLQQGFKPVISFTNTMEGFLEDAPKNVPMDEIPNFSLTLVRALDGVMRYQTTDADGQKNYDSFKLRDLPKEGQEMYNNILTRIKAMSNGLPISPMDAIRMKVEEAGYKVGEITGRNTQLIKDENGKFVVVNREDKDKKAAARDFNNGKLDVLMINKSGSTGISLHASPKFEDQRQRVMVFAQFQSDINDEVQMRGRIDRTGQLYRGKYEYLMSSIPAEQRLQMMFKAKLKSLDANTTSSQKSKFNEMEVVDFLNKYGDEVVTAYMLEHPELEEKLGDPLKMFADGEVIEDGLKAIPADAAGKIARHLAFLPVEEQEVIFKEISDAYNMKIQMLNDAGENDLEITTMPLKAKTLSKKIWTLGQAPDSGNAFADNTYLEEVEVDVLKKPMKSDEAMKLSDKLNGGKPWREYSEEKKKEISVMYDGNSRRMADKITQQYEQKAEKVKEDFIKKATKKREDGKNELSDEDIANMAVAAQKELLEVGAAKAKKHADAIMARRDALLEMLDSLSPGQALVVNQELDEEQMMLTFAPSVGMFLGFKFSKDYTLGSSSAVFATLDGRRKVEIPLSKTKVIKNIMSQTVMNQYLVEGMTREKWDKSIPERTRKKAYIVTGNLMQALVDTKKQSGTKGYLVSYSTEDGGTKQGILMPDRFEPKDLRKSAPVSIKLPQLRSGEKIESEDGKVTIERTYGWKGKSDYTLKVPKSSKAGAKYFADKSLRSLVLNNEFETKGNSMVAYVKEGNIAKVLDRLSKLDVTVLTETKLKDVKPNEDENLYREVTDDGELAWLENQPTVKAYRAMQVIDGRLYSPMASGKKKNLGAGYGLNKWDVATEMAFNVTDEMLEAVEQLNQSDKRGYVEVIPGKLRFVKESKRGKASLKFHLVTDETDVWAAYNPYNHNSDSMLNDQFKAAYRRGNIVVVEAEVPVGDLESGYQAPYSKDAVGKTEWKSGDVAAQFPDEMKRTVYLSRYTKPVRVLKNAEVAKWIGKRLRKAEQLTGKPITLYEASFHPEVKRLLEADGFTFVPVEQPKGKVSKVLEGHPDYMSDDKIAKINEVLSQEDSWLQRGGEVSFSDEEMSYENYPLTKWIGESQRSEKQKHAYAEKARIRMENRVNELAEQLHLDNVEVVTDVSILKGRKARAKGWFDPNTGKIVVVVPNHKSTYDIQQTLLHEAVAHYGLRQLFGEHFDTFLDNVFNNAKESIRRRIVDMAAKNGWDFRKATEEYLASLAEDTEFENINAGWWRQIKDFFLNMLHKLGFEDFGGVTLTDNELRYILWRSYENLKEPGRFRSVFGEAADVAKQYELKVGNYADKTKDAGSRMKKAGEQEEVNRRFNEQLDRYVNGMMDKNEMLHLGRPHGVMELFLPDLPIVMRQRILSKGSVKKHNVAPESLNDMPLHLSEPVFVFKRSDNVLGILTEMQDRDGKNVCVALELNRRIQNGGSVLEVNDVRSVHGRNLSDIVYPIIQNDTLRWVDKEKGLAYLSSASRYVQQEIDNQDLITAVKIVKDFENPKAEGLKMQEDDGVYFREGGELEARERTLARDRYEKRVKSGMFQSQEALQDSMLGLKEAMKAILGKNIDMKDVDGFENAYLGENRLSSVNKAEADAFARLKFMPLIDEIAKLVPDENRMYELTDYMMAKHGLERNDVMARRVATKEAWKEFGDDLRKAQRAADKDPLDDDAADALAEVKRQMQEREEELYAENRSKDYAGLTALTGEADVTDAENVAATMVNEYEAEHDTGELWNKVNDISHSILQKSYECGLMDKATYNEVSAMYRYYIPLRGFDETTSSEAYAYLTHKESAFNAPIKKAKGRKSKADNPLAYLQSMAESTIMQGNRNRLVKQRFLNFALNHPSDLVSVSELWVKYNELTEEWEPVFPGNIEASDTAEEVEQKMQKFEQQMIDFANEHPEKYKKGKDVVGIPYRVVADRDLHQHQVVVKRNGRDYVITINGVPRAAQALNGQTNPDNELVGAIGAVLRAGENVNRHLSAFYTTRNPDFVASNFLRDLLYTNSMSWVKESPNYALRYHRNYVMANPVRMKRLLEKYRNGELNMADKTESLFWQFMRNGGETGYVSIKDIEQHKKELIQEFKKRKGKLPLKKAWDLLGERLDEVNRAVENCARFAAFVTSREMGRTVDRSIYDAKEISVNFNKKGSGAKFYGAVGQTKIGNAASLAGGLGKSGFVFWNAAIQGLNNFGKQFINHPAKAYSGLAALFLLGAVVAQLGTDDDDEEEDKKSSYYNLPEYVRRSNLLFKAGGCWVSIPLPVEYRAVYGLGELMMSTLNGREHLTDGELAIQIASQISQVMPLDLMNDGGITGMVPSAVRPFAEVMMNKGWTGLPIYKDTPYNKYMPEWTKAYKSANKYIVGLSAAMNEASGGDSYTEGKVDWNPAIAEYLLNGYFGGVFNTLNRMTKMVETAVGAREFDPQNFLLLNRVVKAGDERTEYRAINNEYQRLKEEYDRLKSRLKHYENDTDSGIFDYAEKIDFLYNSPEYLRYEIFEEYQGEIDALYDELKITVDGEERKVIEAELNSVKKEMIERINQSRKQ